MGDVAWQSILMRPGARSRPVSALAELATPVAVGDLSTVAVQGDVPPGRLGGWYFRIGSASINDSGVVVFAADPGLVHRGGGDRAGCPWAQRGAYPRRRAGTRWRAVCRLRRAGPRRRRRVAVPGTAVRHRAFARTVPAHRRRHPGRGTCRTAMRLRLLRVADAHLLSAAQRAAFPAGLHSAALGRPPLPGDLALLPRAENGADHRGSVGRGALEGFTVSRLGSSLCLVAAGSPPRRYPAGGRAGQRGAGDMGPSAARRRPVPESGQDLAAAGPARDVRAPRLRRG